MKFFGFFLALSLAWTWPLVTRLSWRIPHDPGDPVLNTWILWWNTQAVPFTAAWWNPPVFFPMPGALALSEHLAGIALFTAPLHFAGVTPLGAYNIALILTGALSGYFAFLLGRRLTGSTVGGLIAGVAFGFAPYRASQLSHLQVLNSQWMPLALFAMHAYLDEGGRRWLLLFAAAWLLQALSNGYYLLFFPVLIALWLAWFVDWRANRARGLALAGTFAAASLLLVPSLLRYKQIHDALQLQRALEEMVLFSAKLTSFVQPARLLTFWPTLRAATQEGFLFPGVTVIALSAAGLVAVVHRRRLVEAIRTRSAAVFYSAAALVFWWLAMGPSSDPTPSLDDALWRPYTLLTLLPGFDGLRVPARFGMIAALCISMAAAMAAARLMPTKRWRQAVAIIVVAAGLFVDGWIDEMPLAPPPQRVLTRTPDDAVVIELPTDEPAANVAAMYRAMAHGRPLVNGYSGHTPRHFDLLTRAMQKGDPSILTHFTRGHSLVVVVHRNLDPQGKWRELAELAGGVLQEESGVGPVFVIPRRPAERTPPLGNRLPGTPVDSPAGYAAIDLGVPQTVRALTINLRGRYARVGPRMTVETSNDGQAWTPVWEGWTGEAALTGGLQDQRAVPMTIHLPDVGARYIRVSPVPLWVAREMTALSPD